MKIKAVTLADITTPNGKKITFDAWNVISSNNHRITTGQEILLILLKIKRIFGEMLYIKHFASPTQAICAETFVQQINLELGQMQN